LLCFAVAVVVFASSTATMQNEEGQMVDLYVPRKWYVSVIPDELFV
jgi:hypothetical protein